MSVSWQALRPDLTRAYQVVPGHLATFLSEPEADGVPLSQYITNEFEAFLNCGIAAHGFLRLACAQCCQEKIAAFSCKKRGWCPLCYAKRQAEVALHLLDDILPRAPYRQMVRGFSFPLRLSAIRQISMSSASDMALVIWRKSRWPKAASAFRSMDFPIFKRAAGNPACRCSHL
jgi:hypothetical protein